MTASFKLAISTFWGGAGLNIESTIYGPEATASEATARSTAPLTPLHRDYLDAFYMEEFDVPGQPMKSSQKRPMVSRDKIHAYLVRVENAIGDPHTAQRAIRSVSKTFSGYVHGASPHIMEMYGGDPPRFHVRGLKHSPLYQDHEYDLWNYFYRGISAFGFAAKAFGDDELYAQITRYLDDFAKASNREVGASP